MFMIIKILLFSLISIFSNESMSIDDAEVNRYLKLLKVGCSVDSHLDITLSADGKLVVLGNNGVGGGSFDIDSSKKESILNALTNDELKGEQATEQRNCQRHYLDKIFGLTEVEQKESSEPVSKVEDGVIYELVKCSKTDRTRIKCDFLITSSFFDRTITLKPIMYDNFGNQYKAEKMRIANFKNDSYNRQLSAPLIADVETSSSVSFVNVNSQASSISKMELLDTVGFKGIFIGEE